MLTDCAVVFPEVFIAGAGFLLQELVGPINVHGHRVRANHDIDVKSQADREEDHQGNLDLSRRVLRAETEL